MKKSLIFLLALTLLFTGCKGGSDTKTSSGEAVSASQILPEAESVIKKTIDSGADEISLTSLKAFNECLEKSDKAEYSEYCELLNDVLNTVLAYSDGGKRSDSLKSNCQKIIENDAFKINLTLTDWYMLAAACAERYKQKDNIVLSFSGDTSFGTYKSAPEETKFEHKIKLIDDYLNYPFKNCLAFFNSDNMTILNNEAAISTRTKMMNKEFQIKADPEFTRIYSLAGVETVNLANNHTKDCFDEGFQDTLDSLRENNINYFDDGMPFTAEIEGVEFVFLGYDMRISLESKSFKDRIVKDIKKHKSEDNILFVNMHWGVEYREQPVAYQKDYARNFIDAGADAVIGAHPHIMQGMETYKGKNILYSMGDFMFGGDPELLSRMTAIFRFYIDRSSKEITLNVIPFYENSDGIKKDSNNYQPIPVFGEEADEVLSYLKRISNPLDGAAEEIPTDRYF